VMIHTKQAPYRTYALAAALPRGSLADALYWDTLDPYHYVRLQTLSEREDIVIVGGEDHKSGYANDGKPRFAALESWARQRLPQMGRIMHRWSGQVMEPVDGVGFVGRNDGDKHRYFVTGDSGQGITNGVIASLLITGLMVDGKHPWTEVYDPARSVTRSLGEFLSQNLTAVASFAEYLTAGDIASVERLHPGEGGTFRSGLKKIAACRDQDGRLYLHSAACTHMGCIVRWNSLEQCWDCPCHGSQFAADGTALNGPAVAPLAEVEPKDKLVAAE
jgi:Rieske Fe-S protein